MARVVGEAGRGAVQEPEEGSFQKGRGKARESDGAQESGLTEGWSGERASGGRIEQTDLSGRVR